MIGSLISERERANRCNCIADITYICIRPSYCRPGSEDSR